MVNSKIKRLNTFVAGINTGKTPVLIAKRFRKNNNYLKKIKEN